MVTTDEARLSLKNRWPELFIRVFELCRDALSVIKSDNKKNFFKLD